LKYDDCPVVEAANHQPLGSGCTHAVDESCCCEASARFTILSQGVWQEFAEAHGLQRLPPADDWDTPWTALLEGSLIEPPGAPRLEPCEPELPPCELGVRLFAVEGGVLVDLKRLSGDSVCFCRIFQSVLALPRSAQIS